MLVLSGVSVAACGQSKHHDRPATEPDGAAGEPSSTGGTAGGVPGGGGPGTDPNAGAGSGGQTGTAGKAPQGGGGGDTAGSGGSGGSGGLASGGAETGGGGISASGAAGAAGLSGVITVGDYGLRGAPLLFAPTADGFGVSVVLTAGDPATLGVHVRRAGSSDWGRRRAGDVRAGDLAEWHVSGLAAGTSYDYSVVGADADGNELELFQGSVTTARAPGSSFSFALLTDTHIGSDLAFSNQGDATLLTETSAQISAAAPDFVVNLGDMLDFHEFGFNTPPPDGSITRAAYLNYRAAYGAPLGSMPHFPVIGGWDSESGCNTDADIERSRTERLLYLPGPTPDTYPEGGSPFQDYYAFTWGDALFVMLNVYTYTPTCHLLDTYPGLPDDWTLGDAQMEWLRTTLENSTSKWRFLLIHHPVGGNGGNDVDSAYGRGGGRAAHVGEQEVVHELMLEHGVQTMFYGHDHVFTDMVVDDIHYSLPGSAGAPWLFTENETGYTQYWADSGWARVDVTPDDVHVQFLDVSGEQLYDYTLE
jgi:hypothetical protein